MPHIDPAAFPRDSLSYSVNARQGVQSRGRRLRVTSTLFATVMGLSYLLGKRTA